MSHSPRETSSDLPHLLRVEQTTAYLGISRSQLQNLFAHLHILRLPGGSRRFPLPYIASLEEFFNEKLAERRVYPARSFARTVLAQAAINAAEHALDERIRVASRDGFITAHNAAAVLNVGRMSLHDWNKTGAIHIELQPYGPHKRPTALLPEDTLRAICQWEYPEDYQPPVS